MKIGVMQTAEGLAVTNFCKVVDTAVVDGVEVQVKRDMTQAEMEAHMGELYPDATGWVLVSAEKLPNTLLHNLFFDALAFVDGEFEFVLERAVPIKMGILRQMRDQLLRELDVQRIIATERGNTDALTGIAEKANALRDMPITAQPALEDARSIEEIYEYVPACIAEMIA